MTSEEKKVQRIVKKLISEEWIAATFYDQMILACDAEQRDVINDIFRKNAEDELGDHYKKLVNFAIQKGYDVPCKISEYEMYADERVVKQFEKWSKGKDAVYYVEQAIKAEEFAIQSYAEVLEDQSVCDCIKRVVLEMYYDEIEHLGTLNTLLIACKVSAKMIV